MTAPGMPPLRLGLDASPSASAASLAAYPASNSSAGTVSTACRVQILGDSVCAQPAGAARGIGDADIAAWCTAAVGAPCTLVRQSQGARSAVLGRAGRSGRSAPVSGSSRTGPDKSFVSDSVETDQMARLDGPNSGRAEPATLHGDGGDSIGALSCPSSYMGM